MATRTYRDAISALNTLQSNFAVIDAIRKSGRSMNARAIPEMLEWTRRIGYQPSDLDCLNIIHIAGTKGKGSTSAFISSILCQHLGASDKQSKPLRKVGLYTSPHLRFVRERIQINNKPLSEELFTKYFFEVWDRLEASARDAGEPTDNTAKPVYFRYLTLVAFHTYISEGVDAAVIECGIGGEHDSTNIMTKPVVTGITSLGIDHTAMLGDTIDKIAWHKAGIMKKGTKAFTAPQLGDAMQVLKTRAGEKEVELQAIDIRPDIASGAVKIGLDADFQKINASLAVAIADEFLTKLGYTQTSMDNNLSLSTQFNQGLQSVQIGGRCETRTEGPNLSWYIDGGHTLESIELVGKWFSIQISKQQEQHQQQQHLQSPPQPSSHRILIFNQADRDANSLARHLHSTLSTALSNPSPFQTVIFCTNTAFKPGPTSSRPDLISVRTATQEGVEKLPVQNALADTWREIEADSENDESSSSAADVRVVPTIEEAVEIVRNVAKADEKKVMALVTGSLHLVGGLLEVLDSSSGSSSGSGSVAASTST